MSFRSIVVAWVLVTSVASLACAQAEDEGQKPPAEQQSAPEQKPPEQPKCVTSKTEWKQNGKSMAFVIELQNACEMRLKCTVEAYVLGSRGPAQGHGALTLAPKSKGQAAVRSYALKVKSMGDMANVSHSCKEI